MPKATADPAGLSDFGADHTLPALLAASSPPARSIATLLPDLHAVGATRTCINLLKPLQKQFWWQGKSDGVWYSHQLIRDVGPLRHAPRSPDPCAKLEQVRAPLPDDFDVKQLSQPMSKLMRDQAIEVLAVPPPLRAKLSDQDLRKKLLAVPPAPKSAHYRLRRRLEPRRGSELALGDRANLDVRRLDGETPRPPAVIPRAP